VAVIKKYEPGHFCWTDMDSLDIKQSKKFYTSLFGWKAKDIPGGPGRTYTLLRVAGKDAAGMYSMLPAERKKKVKPAWLPFISVKSVAATVKKAIAAGAKIDMPATKVMDMGRMAILRDTVGAEVAVWQAGKHIGAQLDGKNGTMTWHDLSTKDTRAASKFYTKVFGWKQEIRKFGDEKYYLFTGRKDDYGGMWATPLPGPKAGWVTYFRVADCKEAVAKAVKMRGKALIGPFPLPNMGSFAILADPKGAIFGIFGR
jgi:predicted enzyme related to lactoylglutathione lyase